MKSNQKAQKRMLHVVIGTPDVDNCPICQAHAQPNGTPPDGSVGPVNVQELSLSQVLRCPCPLCAQARQEELEG